MFAVESRVCMTLSWKSCTRATSHCWKCCDLARSCTRKISNAFSLFPASTNLPIQRYVDQSEFTSLQQSTVRLRLILIYRVKSLTPCCHHPKNSHEKNMYWKIKLNNWNSDCRQHGGTLVFLLASNPVIFAMKPDFTKSNCSNFQDRFDRFVNLGWNTLNSQRYEMVQISTNNMCTSNPLFLLRSFLKRRSL